MTMSRLGAQGKGKHQGKGKDKGKYQGKGKGKGKGKTINYYLSIFFIRHRVWNAYSSVNCLNEK